MHALFPLPHVFFGYFSELTLTLMVQTIMTGLLVFFVSKNSFLQMLTLECQMFISKLVSNYISTRQYDNIFFSLFFFIAMNNLLSNFGFFALFAWPYAPIIMSGTIFCTTILIGLYNKGLRFFQDFCPPGLPKPLKPFVFLLEFLLFLVRPLSLGTRLLLNVSIGHLLLFVFYTYLPIGMLPVAIIIQILEMVTGIIQAFLFVNFAAHIVSIGLEEAH